MCLQNMETGLDLDTLALIDRIKNEPAFREYAISAVSNYERMVEFSKKIRQAVYIENSTKKTKQVMIEYADFLRECIKNMEGK